MRRALSRARLDRRQQQGDQQPDDGDHDQQLDQGESGSGPAKSPIGGAAKERVGEGMGGAFSGEPTRDFGLS